jgi:uncharacterized protein YbcI
MGQAEAPEAAGGALIEAGDHEHVQLSRKKFQDAAEDEFIDVVERITGRKVASLLCQVDTRRDLAIEVFIFEGVTSGRQPDGR